MSLGVTDEKRGEALRCELHGGQRGDSGLEGEVPLHVPGESELTLRSGCYGSVVIYEEGGQCVCFSVQTGLRYWPVMQVNQSLSHTLLQQTVMG